MAETRIQFTHSSIQEYLATERLCEAYYHSDDKDQFLGTLVENLISRSPLWRRAIPDFFFGLIGLLKKSGTSEGKQTKDFTDDEAWPAPALWRHAPEACTTVFTDKADLLVQVIERGTDLVVIEGAPGMGKSRVAAALFEPDRVSGSLPVWYFGNRAEGLLESIGAVRREFPTQKLCIILDEEHQPPVRDERFFVEFFQSGARQALRGQHQVVLVLRTSTYDTLSAKSFLVRADTIAIASDTNRLDRNESWGLSCPLSTEEKEWIQAIASDENGYLISFLVDRVCIPELKRDPSLKGQPFKLGGRFLKRSIKDWLPINLRRAAN